jgi:aldehyde dehydrogenase (NAD+)
MHAQSDELPCYQLYIDGEWTDSVERQTMPAIEAALCRPMARVARGDAADADRAVHAARKAFDHGPWPHTPPHARAKILLELADLIEEHTTELAELESRNLGVPLRKSMFVDVVGAIDHFRTFAELARRDSYEPLPWTDVPSLSWNFVLREPIGVCAQIVPWNYPLLMAAWKMAPALATGNTLVLKPASYTPLTAIRLFEIIHGSGLLPHGTVNLVTGPGETVGEALAGHPGVDKVSFTGSTAVGGRIMELASPTVKRVTLELGGKSPSIVMPDAVELDQTIDGVLFAAFFNAGQSCEAATRCFVPSAAHDAFVARLVARARQLRLGDPMDLETDMGPLVSERQAQAVEEYIAIGLREGAALALGGKRAQVAGFEQAAFLEPTIFTGVRNEMRIAQEEIFGPVLVVIPYDTLSEAITLSNQSAYGLGAAVWSRDIPAAIEIARRLRTGSVWINDYHVILATTPFGGYKQSGVGREHGLLGMLEYTQAKRIHVDLHQRREQRILWDILLPE